jgi:hypothetical protein
MTRQFPDQDEVDQWLASDCLDEADANASSVVNQFQAAAVGILSAELGRWRALNIADHERTGIRGAAREVMATESFGILSLCSNTQQVRPLLLICADHRLHQLPARPESCH